MVGVEVELVVHPDMAMEARTVSAPTPNSRALSVNPAMVVRSLIEPPCAPYAVVRFPVPASQTHTTRNNGRLILALAEGSFPNAPTTTKVTPAGGTDVQ
jgi:hypothetical protein